MPTHWQKTSKSGMKRRQLAYFDIWPGASKGQKNGLSRSKNSDQRTETLVIRGGFQSESRSRSIRLPSDVTRSIQPVCSGREKITL